MRDELDYLSDELRQFLAEVDAAAAGALSPEYRPPMDVVETAESIEILADLPGVQQDAVRVAFMKNSVVVAGRKGPPACEHRQAAFHVVERTFGLFATVVPMPSAVDAGRARATLHDGELHIVLPRVDERRGREIRIPVDRR